MFEKFTAVESPNFRQRYQGTYGFFRKDDNKVLVRLDQITTGDSRALVEFSDRTGVKYRLYSDSDDQSVGFEFIPPKCQYHNTESGTYLVKRTAAKQYLRGICDRNTSIRTVNGVGMPVGFDILHAIYDHPVDHLTRYNTITDPEFDDEKSFAISSQFAISLETGRIFCLQAEIGTARMRYGKLTIVLNDASLWKTEIKDCLTRTGIKGIIA